MKQVVQRGKAAVLIKAQQVLDEAKQTFIWIVFFFPFFVACSTEVVKSEVWTAGPWGRGEDVARLEEPD